MKSMGLLLLLLACCAAGVAGETGDFATTRAEWNLPAEPFRVIGNIYYVGTDELGSWLLVTPAGDILIDGALPESAPLIERNIERLGFHLQDVKILLNSHAHFDHAGGLATLKRDTGANLIASEGDRTSLETGTFLGSEKIQALDFPPVKVDRLVRDGDTVSIGDAILTAHLTPGHTRGCTTWTMPLIDQGEPHTVIFYCSTWAPVNRLVGDPQYPGIVDDYRRSFAKLASLHADVFLANHKDYFDVWKKRATQKLGGPNPFIDPSALPSFVAQSQAAFEQELVRQEKARQN